MEIFVKALRLGQIKHIIFQLKDRDLKNKNYTTKSIYSYLKNLDIL